MGEAERFLRHKPQKKFELFLLASICLSMTAGGQTFCTTESSRIGYRIFQVLSLRFCFLFAVTLYFNLYIQHIVQYQLKANAKDGKQARLGEINIAI